MLDGGAAHTATDVIDASGSLAIGNGGRHLPPEHSGRRRRVAIYPRIER